MNMKLGIVVLFLGTILLVLAGCGSNDDMQKATPKPEGNSEQQVVELPSPEQNQQQEEQGQDDEQEVEQEPEEQPEETPDDNENMSSGNTVEIDVKARSWEFEPRTIRVRRGDTIILHLESEDVAHGFWLSAFGIQERLEPGQVVDASFVADKEGTFSYVCSVPCGKGHGDMRGTLIVE
ncbi:cupredoxin domain-containing protein [Candidatus Woesearchaeota archaeon]|nr:cupredoxin domain-containing protein [Candidatus Woesearchaeota archaeon]